MFIRGEREWHLGVREREREWIIQFPKFGNRKGIEKTHSLNSGTGREWKKTIPKIREWEGNEKLDPVGSTVRYEMMELCTGSV